MKFWPQEKTRNQSGLSVLELLIILSAIAIVVLISTPASTMILEKYRAKTAYASLLSGLELAIGEAQKRSSTVRVCPSSNGHTCRADGNWNLGWLVYSDGNNNRTVQDIELIQAFEAPHQSVRITAWGAVESTASFTATGLVETADAKTGRFKICLRGSDTPPRVVNINEEGWVELVPGHNEVCESS